MRLITSETRKPFSTKECATFVTMQMRYFFFPQRQFNWRVPTSIHCSTHCDPTLLSTTPASSRWPGLIAMSTQQSSIAELPVKIGSELPDSVSMKQHRPTGGACSCGNHQLSVRSTTA